MSSNSQKLTLENALFHLDRQITSQAHDYVTEMMAVNLRFKRVNDEFTTLAVVESNPERFLAAASEFIHLMALMKKLDDDLESIVAKDVVWRETFILLLKSMTIYASALDESLENGPQREVADIGI